MKPGSHYRQQIVPSNFCSKPAHVMFALTKIVRHVASQVTKWLMFSWDLLPNAGSRTHCNDPVVFLIQFSSLHAFTLFKPKMTCMIKLEDLGKIFWFSGLLEHQDLGQVQKFIPAFKVCHWTSPYFMLFSVEDCRVLSEEGKGKFQNKLGDL